MIFLSTHRWNQAHQARNPREARKVYIFVHSYDEEAMVVCLYNWIVTMINNDFNSFAKSMKQKQKGTLDQMTACDWTRNK